MLIYINFNFDFLKKKLKMIITYKSIFSKLRDIVKVFMRCTYINKHNKYISINSLVVKILSV